MKQKKIILFFLFILSLSVNAQQPSDFNFTPTNNFASLYGQVQLNSQIINSNSWIAAFDENGICSGATPVISYDGISFFNLTVYGDDILTSEIDEGLSNQETFYLKIFHFETNQYYDYTSDNQIVYFDQWINTNGSPLSGFSDPYQIFNFQSNIYGCTDSTACNYNTFANIDDGQCALPSFSNQNIYLCNTDLPFEWNNIEYSNSGQYSLVLENSQGCDSTATINLIVNNSSFSTTQLTVCDSIDWNGNNYNESGEYTFETQNSYGCDSTATLILTVNQSSFSSTYIRSCEPIYWNNILCDYSGIFSVVLTNSVGCDSTAYLDFELINIDTSITNITFCDEYFWNGQLYNQSGTYDYFTTSYEGCDSVAKLNLTILSSSESYSSVSSCDSYSWNDQMYYQSGSYTYLTTNSEGCDSVANLDLTILSSSASDTYLTSCEPINWNGINCEESGFYSTNLLASNGCDSIINLYFTLIQLDSSFTDVTSCDSYFWNNQLYTQSATYSFQTTGTYGCDSVAILNLNIENSYSSEIEITACDEYLWNGNFYTISGVYNISTISQNGCDSTNTLNLIVGICGCMDESAFNYNSNAVIDDDSCIPVILGCTDQFANNYNELANTDDGSCGYEIYGCLDQSACNFDPIADTDDGSCTYVSANYNINHNLCPNQSQGNIFVTPIQGQAPFSFQWNNGSTSSVLSNLPSGNYIITLTDFTGCQITDTLTLVEPVSQVVDITPEICYVTVDDQAGKNKIVLNPISLESVAGYQIFKETLTDVYVNIATLDANTLDYVDMASNPLVTTNRYKVKAIDNCLLTSNISEYHQTVHLSMNVGLNGSVNLDWDQYQGFDVSSYMVFRGPNLANMEFLQFVSGNNTSYSDLNPPLGTSIYQIRVVAPICNPIDGNNNLNQALIADTLKSNVVENDYEDLSLDVNLIINQPSCSTCEDGSIIALPFNGVTPYTIVWSNDIYTNSNSNLGEGTYILYLSDIAGGYLTDTIVLQSNSVLGCTDASADNFDPNANIDDGSCNYCNEFEVVMINISDATLAGASNGSIQATGQGGSNNYEVTVVDGNGVPQNSFALAAGDYTVTVIDVTSGCEASTSITISEPTVAEDPCDIVPTGLFVDDIIHNRVVFNWSAPSAAPSHYMIRYRQVGTSSWTVMTAGPVNTNEFTGTSRTRYFMQPGTTYQWNIRARVLNQDGSTNCQSPWSASSQYTTLEACANLENLSASTEANWVTLGADAPDASWGVWQSKGKVRVIGTNSFRYLNGNANGDINVLKGNFIPSTDYQWHTKAWCMGNVDSEGNPDPMYHSGWGDFSAFTTEALCDKMPTNLSTSANGAQTAITMSWDTPESGEPDHYFLELTNVTTGQVWAWNNIPGSSNSKTKFGLTQGDYSWRIRGACGTNGTSWATIFSQPVTYTLGGARIENNAVVNLDVYPNPSRDIFYINFTSQEMQTIIVKIVNLIGKEIFIEELTEFTGQYTKEIDMDAHSKGVYFLEIINSKNSLNKKIILQ